MRLDLSKVFKPLEFPELSWDDFQDMQPVDFLLDGPTQDHPLKVSLKVTPAESKEPEFRVQCSGVFQPLLVCDECLQKVQQDFQFNEEFIFTLLTKGRRAPTGRDKDSLEREEEMDIDVDLTSIEIEKYLTSDSGEADLTSPVRDVLNDFIPLHFFCSQGCEESSQKVLSAGSTPSKAAEIFSVLKGLDVSE